MTAYILCESRILIHGSARHLRSFPKMLNSLPPRRSVHSVPSHLATQGSAQSQTPFRKSLLLRRYRSFWSQSLEYPASTRVTKPVHLHSAVWKRSLRGPGVSAKASEGRTPVGEGPSAAGAPVGSTPGGVERGQDVQAPAAESKDSPNVRAGTGNGAKEAVETVEDSTTLLSMRSGNGSGEKEGAGDVFTASTPSSLLGSVDIAPPDLTLDGASALPDGKQFARDAMARSVTVGAVMAAESVYQRILRRRGKPKVPGWSLIYEVIVDVARASLPHVLNTSLISVYRDGTPQQREEIGQVLSRVNRVVNRLCRPIPVVPGVTPRRLQVGDMEALWLLPGTKQIPGVDGAEGTAQGGPYMLYLHGGAYLTCSVHTHKRMVSAMTAASGAPTLLVNYRLPPEGTFEHMLQDAIQAFDHLLACGVPAKQVVVGGDSAGGHLALALSAHLVRERGAGAAPGAVVALSPWIDMNLSHAASPDSTWVLKGDIDYLGFARGNTPAPIIFGMDDATGEVRDHPLKNLLELDAATLRGMPPLLVQYGGQEVLCSEIGQFIQAYNAARAEGEGEAEVEMYDNMVHVWHFFADVELQAALALTSAGAFIRQTIQP